jgi:hypothetical protein
VRRHVTCPRRMHERVHARFASDVDLEWNSLGPRMRRRGCGFISFSISSVPKVASVLIKTFR